MQPSGVSLFSAVLLGVSAALLAGPTMVHAEGSNVPPDDEITERNTTTDGPDTLCTDKSTPRQRRQDLLDIWLRNEVDTRLNERESRQNGLEARLNEKDTRLNDLSRQQNEVNTRLNRMDSRLDRMETGISDIKEYLRQRMDAMEVKAEWALTGTKNKRALDNNIDDLDTRFDTLQKEVNARLNATDGRLDEIETAVSVGSSDNRPNKTSQMPKDCQEAYTMGLTSSGVYKIAPEPNTQIDVYCEQQLSGGGWIVFQVRKDGSLNFYRDWSAYRYGFGEMTGEFWLGNTNLHLLTKCRDQELKVELTSPQGEVQFADYSHFAVAPEDDAFRLTVTGYTGSSPPGDSMALHNGAMFSTRDADHDGDSSYSWATEYQGAWWYPAGGAWSNLNGRYGGTGGNGVWWYKWKSYTSLKGSRMLLRKKP